MLSASLLLESSLSLADQDSRMAGALEGITVLDLSRVLAGPYATMLLGDMGARVIKIEQPGRGDDTRHWGPPFTPTGESAYFLCANRNKQSVTLNLKSPEGRDVLSDMVRRADVFVENFKVGELRKFGFDYANIKAINPTLIYCSITGYGQTGPYQARPGYDVVIQAQGGLMSITGPPDGEPFKVGVAVVDITAGMQAAIAILAALHHRQHSGEGQYIDIALFDTQLGWLANVASAYLVSGQPPQRYGNAHPSIVPYQPVSTADGSLMLAVGNDDQFARLCQSLGHREWAADARFTTNRDRVVHRAELIPLLETEFAKRTTAAWSAELIAAGVPCGPVNDIPAALADPQTQARAMLQSITHPVTGDLPLIGPVPKFSATPAHIYLPPPLLGEHTESLLAEWLEYSEDQIAALRQAAAI